MNKFERLKELNKLFDDGIITQEEYDHRKLIIMNDEEADSSENKGIEHDTLSTKNKRPLSKKRKWYILLIVIVALVAGFILMKGFKQVNNKISSSGTIPYVNVYFDAEEVFPVYLLYLKNTKKGFMELNITNPDNKPRSLELSYGFTEFGRLDSQKVDIDPNSVIKMQINPFSAKMMEVVTPLNTTFTIKLTDDHQTGIFSKSWGLKINPCDEIPWKIKNQDLSKLIASWITPQNGSVEALMMKVKEKMGGNRVSINNMSDEDFSKLVKSIFNTVKDEGINYINGTISFGEGYSQRIRLPNLTLKSKLANCIDGSVLLASLFENAGLRPYIIILPEHALVGVSRANQKSDMIYIETTLLGRSTLASILSFETTFTTATRKGKEEYNNAYSQSVNKESGRFSVIDIHKARLEGVLPLN